MRVCQTVVVRPRCSGVHSACATSPTAIAAKKLVLLSSVAVEAPGGRFATAAVPPRLSASAISAPPCSVLFRLVSCGVTGSSAVTRARETWVIFMPMKVANGGCSFGFISKLRAAGLSSMASRLPHSDGARNRAQSAMRQPFGGQHQVLAGQLVAGGQRLVGDIDASLAKESREQSRTIDRDQFIGLAGQHEK